MASRFIIITGMSGAGRSEAIRAFEDLGYFCVDNLPPSLAAKFAELANRSPDVHGAALGMDIRGGSFFPELAQVLDELDAQGTSYEILFLEADEETLIHRYKLSRRRHPLEAGSRLVEAIRQERAALEELRGRADLVIDTSGLTPLQLRQRLNDAFRLQETVPFQIRLVSFGFKHGLPKDADLVFDVRFLPNPHYVPELHALTGNEGEVDAYVMGFPLARETLERLSELLDFLIPQFHSEGKPVVTVAVGCTGGQHRSVVFANRLASHLKNGGHAVWVEHRDLPPRTGEV
ncbi:RNase adapter RapZ [Sulfobacillus harzensis]|uniref:RNase adapter RapZ n=1 Tax=Sulfobacillus harzensis TaxID=2729629 RepID=A0A7Y0Q2L9_9FIRM|nr:RNase adapter RapZ [Sulfobacillus harzensis]NMP22667.1 RNase adapter RapZ [Sulfobacillus harzensis]